VLFADVKGSMELLADRDPEEARKLIDPVLERMMEAVHRYEGTVNQVMGDGVMALFGAPLAHEDHAVRACYAALRMHEALARYAADLRRSHGVDIQIRVGLNSGDVVVRAIGSESPGRTPARRVSARAPRAGPTRSRPPRSFGGGSGRPSAPRTRRPTPARRVPGTGAGTESRSPRRYLAQIRGEVLSRSG
jgi:hypothetical protein